MEYNSEYGISLLSIIPMRSDPAEEAEMVSQLLFGEHYEIQNERDGFFEIKNRYDNYTGWIDCSMHSSLTAEFYHHLESEKNQPVQTCLIMSIEQTGYPPMQIVAGSTLPGLNTKKNSFEIDGITFHIRWSFEKFAIKGFESINKTAAYFLNTPYLWGGRTTFGCDCSGFIQNLFKIHGISLQRDADQQAEQGRLVPDVREAQPGDVAFFADDEGNVVHVGMVISPSEIIHSSGYVHIDRLDEKGIFNLKRQEYSHTLHSIKRMV
ncbi:MAG TPA: C40 family peptidase [Bacteroidales bacterium]|nr:C40 family peptidase [Bacteroidales bacterium]